MTTDIRQVNEIRIQTWDELSECLLGETWNEELQRFRSPFVFRGMQDAGHGLETTLFRLGPAPETLEAPLLRSFKKYAPRSSVDYDSTWNWLAVAQHHGLPTRLLDWSFSPYIAAHFATQNIDHFDTDGVIWSVNFNRAHDYLPPPLRSILSSESASLFTIDMLDRATKSLHEFDRLGDKPFVVFFEPPSIEGRIANQYALFSVLSGARLCLDDWLEDKPDVYTRIVIPAALKWEIRDKLDMLNINERLLFPGLDGLSRWLKRYYTPRPRASSPRPSSRAE